MKALKIFYLEHCPYCRMAKKAFEELKSENPECGRVTVEWIEESRCPALADSFDYYRVPSIFCGDKKLYECSPGEDYGEIRRQMGNALQTAAAG